MIKYLIEETFDNKYMCKLNESGYAAINGNIKTSYIMLEVRLFGLSYADFLRMMRDKYGAKLYGKTGYAIYKFDTKAKAKVYLDDLNDRLGGWN